MNNENVIAFCEKQVRINNVEGEYWFCLKDVLDSLGTTTRKSQIVWDDKDEVVKDYPIGVITSLNGVTPPGFS